VWLGLGFATWYTIDATTFRFFAVALALSAMAGLLTAYENKE
jgi:phage shock protein PspC (stress-responsive transcriptional regulator)